MRDFDFLSNRVGPNHTFVRPVGVPPDPMAAALAAGASAMPSVKGILTNTKNVSPANKGAPTGVGASQSIRAGASRNAIATDSRELVPVPPIVAWHDRGLASSARPTHRLLRAAIGAVSFALSASPLTAVAQPVYSTTPLGDLGGGVTQATDINNAGQIVGWSRTASGATHWFIWTRAAGMQDMGPANPSKLAINQLGHVVGLGVNNRPFLWTPGGTQTLPTLGGSLTYPTDLNDLDYVVGSGQTLVCTTDHQGITTCVDGPEHAWVWSPSGGIIDLGTLATALPFDHPHNNSSAYGINNAGVVVGTTRTNFSGCCQWFCSCVNQSHPFRWTPGSGMVDLGLFPGGLSGAAQAINDAGQIGGTSQDASGYYSHAFILNPGGVMQDIHGYCVSSAISSINASGEVVGIAGGSQSCGDAHPFLYNGTFVDLRNPTNWAITPPASIAFNDAGQIAATGDNYFGGPTPSYLFEPCLSVAVQGPSSTTTCRSGPTTFSVTAAGTGPFTYQWQWRPTSGQFANILDGVNTDPQGGPITFTASGARNATVNIENIGGGGTAGSHWEQRCIVTNACGSVTSNPATLTICVADTDDGSGTGACDGGVTIDDLLYYLFIFEVGELRADVDDGSGTGTPDGGVTIDDLLYYLLRFEAGC